MEGIGIKYSVDPVEKLSQKECELKLLKKRLIAIKMLYFGLKCLLFKNGGSLYAGRIRYSRNHEVNAAFYAAMKKLKDLQEKYNDLKKECRELYGPVRAKVVYL